MSGSVIPDWANEHVKTWVAEERDAYASKKWEVDNADRQREVIEDGTWVNFPASYISRAEGMGLDTPQGRQALGKVISTCESLLARAVTMYGGMPEPGLPSGEIVEDWCKIRKKNPEVVPSPEGMVKVEDGQATLFSQPEEGDDSFGLQA